MPSCWKCGSEIDATQEYCAWCGEKQKTAEAQPKFRPPSGPPPSSTPTPFSSGATGTAAIDTARRAAQAGDLDRSLILFQDLLTANPSDQEALFGMGGVHFKKGEFAKAAEAWMRLKVFNPDYPNIDDWITKARDKAASAPATPRAPATPTLPPSAPQQGWQGHSAPPPPPDFSKPGTPPPPSGASRGGEDWQKSMVRVDKTEPPPEPPPPPKPKKKPPKPEMEAGPPVDPLPTWLVPTGWALMVVYAVAVYVIYFS